MDVAQEVEPSTDVGSTASLETGETRATKDTLGPIFQNQAPAIGPAVDPFVATWRHSASLAPNPEVAVRERLRSVTSDMHFSTVTLGRTDRFLTLTECALCCGQVIDQKTHLAISLPTHSIDAFTFVRNLVCVGLRAQLHLHRSCGHAQQHRRIWKSLHAVRPAHRAFDPWHFVCRL